MKKGLGYGKETPVMFMYDKVKNAMLAFQRTTLEQGFAAQALLEAGESELVIAMAHEAVLKQDKTGRLAVLTGNVLITDPGAMGEVVWRAFEMTDNEYYKTGAEKMLEYYMIHAPHTEDGIIYYSTKSLDKGGSPFQLWADSCYAVPTFLAIMNELIEAVKQLVGYMTYLRDEETGLLHRAYDLEKKTFVRKEFNAQCNVKALLGIAGVIDEAYKQGEEETAHMFIETGIALIDAVLKFKSKNGLVHETLDNPKSPEDVTASMMAASFIYHGISAGWLAGYYKENADKIRTLMRTKVDDYGIVHDVSNSLNNGSCLAQAAFIMMEVWGDKL